MKKIFIVVIPFLLIIILSGCGSSGNTPAPRANLVVDGNITTGITSYDRPYFSGTVKNIGNNTAWNASITFTIYSNPEKTNIVDTAFDALASGHDIAPGQTVIFEAVAFNSDSIEDLQCYTYKINWLEK